jgi:hypothetical protein
LGSLQEASVTTTFFAPASNASFTTSATTSGFVFAACTGMRSQPMFGLIATTSPFETKRFIPPSAATARRVSSAGSVVLLAIAITGLSAGATVKLLTWRSPLGDARSKPPRSKRSLAATPAPTRTVPARARRWTASRRDGRSTIH